MQSTVARVCGIHFNTCLCVIFLWRHCVKQILLKSLHEKRCDLNFESLCVPLKCHNFFFFIYFYYNIIADFAQVQCFIYLIGKWVSSRIQFHLILHLTWKWNTVVFIKQNLKYFYFYQLQYYFIFQYISVYRINCQVTKST